MASKEIGLELNADKTEYMVMSRDPSAGRSHSLKIDDNSFERVEEFKYLGTALTLRRLMSYIYMEHPFLMFLDHTRPRSTVGRAPLDE